MRRIHFEAQEWASVSERFNLIAAADYPLESTMPINAVLDHACCEQILQQLSPLLRSPSLKITASLLSKRVAFLVTAAAFYPLSIYNKGLNMALDNCLLDACHDGHRWQSHLPLYDLSLSAPCSEQARWRWRDDIIEGVFAGHLTPLWQVLSAVSGISSRILWENTAVRLFSLYEHRMEMPDNAADLRAKQDFHYLVHEAPGILFGLEENPLTPYFRAPIWVSERGEWIRFRRTCCFYYQASLPQAFCQSCPLLKPNERKRRPFSE